MKKVNYIEDFQSWKNEFEFFVPFNIRFSETDMFGHVNNTVPFVYFETARIEYLNYLGLYKEGFNMKEVGDHIPVVADLQCDYIQQIFFGDELRIYVKVSKVGNSSVDIHYLGVKAEDTVCLTGRGTIVNINKYTGKAEQWTDEVKGKLLQSKKVSVV